MSLELGCQAPAQVAPLGMQAVGSTRAIKHEGPTINSDNIMKLMQHGATMRVPPAEIDHATRMGV